MRNVGYNIFSNFPVI